MRKYSCEFGLNVYSSYQTVIPVEFLDRIDDGRKYHIYGILATPRVIAKPESIVCNENGISLELIEINNGKENTIKIENFSEFPNIDYRLANISIKYPYTTINIDFPKEYLKKYLKGIDETRMLPESMLDEIIKNINEPRDIQYIAESKKYTVDMEVLYIGQAFGSNGERTAIHRLKSHEKLQKILIDCHPKHPDKRIFIMLLEMSPILNTVFDGISKDFICSEKQSDEHLVNVMSNKLKENQIINVAEAAIINYFKPKYNTNFIDNFPNINHKGYRQYYDLDYNSISVEIDMEFDNKNIILYTSENRLGPWQYIRYNIFNDPNRDDMYEMFTKKLK